MKIALIGYGKMGREVEKQALQRNHSIVARLDSSAWLLNEISAADLCIDFSHPEALLENILKVGQAKKELIIGTTGWQSQLEEVRSLAEEHEMGVLFSPNFSLGMALLLLIADYTSNLMGAFEEYEVAGVEYHHHAKKDAPSGTALAITEVVEKNIPHQSLHFASVRSGSFPGTHTLLFDSPCDTLSITHTARNREGFALGAVKAAEWLLGKKGFFTLEDLIQSLLNKQQS